MPRFLGRSLQRTWLLLMIATGAAFGLRAEGFVGVAPGAATLALAYAKGRLVVLDFMELRHAPPLWRGIVEGWLLVVSLSLLAIYWMGSTAVA
jgi:hypothetical protein